MTTKEETVTLEQTKKWLRMVETRLGLLHLAFCKTLVDELGKEKGKALIMKAIKDYGIRVGERVKAKVTAQGLDTAPANFQADLPPQDIMHETVEITEPSGEKREVKHCTMAKVWLEYGEGELGALYCYVDTAKTMAFNPNFKWIHTKIFPLGDETCELEFSVPTTEQEKRDFADKDKDWSYINPLIKDRLR